MSDNHGRLGAWSHDASETLGHAFLEPELVGPPCMSSACRYSDSVTSAGKCSSFQRACE
ncbi:hypothetical protein GF325_19340 [Candidatus Bathyarchaeota archaeon]|nr:hypothetical protein [Candidatus Bathyarchaeota archaeon]